MFNHLRQLVPVLALLLGTVPVQAADGNDWSRASMPAGGSALAIGSTAHGCLAGGAMLALDGPGYEVIHPSRRRYYGHPDTVAFVERLGLHEQMAGLPPFYVGDMAQPRGGPLPFGHASHQTGLDVDIWFTLETKPLLVLAAREDIALPSMLLASWRAVDPKRFGARQMTLLHLAASDPRVDRIFVNPVIKTALCRVTPAQDRSWLGKLRPWWGHDDHFHVRLACPSGSHECERQAPVPPGDGCDATLASWVRDQHPPPLHEASAALRPMPILPAECRAILTSH
jgi:penicillin-insensitive murein endopeptidase